MIGVEYNILIYRLSFIILFCIGSLKYIYSLVLGLYAREGAPIRGLLDLGVEGGEEPAQTTALPTQTQSY